MHNPLATLLPMNPIVKAYLAEIGGKGGAAGTGQAKARTSAQAKKAANARWEKERAKNQTSKRKKI